MIFILITLNFNSKIYLLFLYSKSNTFFPKVYLEIFLHETCDKVIQCIIYMS